MIYWSNDLMPQEIMNSETGAYKVSPFTLKVLEDLEYFIVDYS